MRGSVGVQAIGPRWRGMGHGGHGLAEQAGHGLRGVRHAGLRQHVAQDGSVARQQHGADARELLALERVHVRGGLVGGAERGRGRLVRLVRLVGRVHGWQAPGRGGAGRVRGGWRGRAGLGLLAESLTQLRHVEQALDLQLLGDLHDARDLRLRDVHLAGVHVLQQGAHLELLDPGEQDAAVVHGHVHEDGLEVRRVGRQDDPVRLELHVLVHDYRAVHVVLHLYEDIQYFHQIRLVVIPPEAVGLSLTASHLDFFLLSVKRKNKL